MPLYEYHCVRCDIKFDLLRPFSRADSPAPCPDCQADDTKRAISLFAAISIGSDGSTSSVAGSGGCAQCASGGCASCTRH